VFWVYLHCLGNVNFIWSS